MSEERRIYLYAATVHAVEGEGEDKTFDQFPTMLLASSMLDASERIEKIAKERWPVTRSWWGHSATIVVADKDLLYSIAAASQMGDLCDGKEPQSHFDFDVRPFRKPVPKLK